MQWYKQGVEVVEVRVEPLHGVLNVPCLFIFIRCEIVFHILLLLLHHY